MGSCDGFAEARATIEITMAETHRLFVLRHAKSSWEDPGMGDHERPLAPRGHRAVKVLKQYMEGNRITPGQVLCSPARRTRETLEGIEPGGEWLIEPELYDASCDGVLERLRRVPDEVESVMVVGHNPAMQMLVLRLCGGGGPAGDGSPLAQVQRKFPTGGLATLTFEGSWSELGPGGARLEAFVRPKALGVS
jgi:phosphohistidine phosphatase